MDAAPAGYTTTQPIKGCARHAPEDFSVTASTLSALVAEQVAEQLLRKGRRHQLRGRHEAHQLLHHVVAQLAPLAGAAVHQLAPLGRPRTRQLLRQAARRGCAAAQQQGSNRTLVSISRAMHNPSAN